MNRVFLTGRLTKDPDLRFTPGKGTAVTTITLAVDKYNRQTEQKEADFINVVIWGKQAESTANYMRKGSKMGVIGKLQTRSYDDNNGSKRYITEVVAEEIEFLGNSRKKDEVPPDFNTGFDDMTPVDDGDVPF